jgi:hypothetical protein
VFKADSSADRHYVSDDVPLFDATDVSRRVYTADKTTCVDVTEQGTLAGTSHEHQGWCRHRDFG